MFESPGPPVENTIALTAAPGLECGVNWNAIGIVLLAGSERSSGTATVPQRACGAAAGPHFPKFAVGAAAAVAGRASDAATASRTGARDMRGTVRPSAGLGRRGLRKLLGALLRDRRRRRRDDRADVAVRGLVEVDDHGRVIGRALALARLAVDPRGLHALGDRVGRQDEVDPHPEVLVEHARAVVPVGEDALA